MKVSAEQKALNRKAILETAGRLLRIKGPEGLGVAEVMDGAGLTHGGFYGYFPSKEQLAAETVAQALAEATSYAGSAVDDAGFEAFLCGYLSTPHLDDVEAGCPIAATLSDIPRQPQAVRAAFAAGMENYLKATTKGHDRQTALARLTAMIGALALARALQGEDRPLAEEILAAVREDDRPG